MDRTTFIHFNDVYNAEKAPRFVHSLKSARTDAAERKSRVCFTAFSGDAFSPSILSTVVRGEQMVPVLNAVGIDAACLGNHDLDFGLREFGALRAKCNFPWLCSNARSVPDGYEPLGGCEEYAVLDKTSEGGPRVLALGLVEAGWIETLSTIEPEDVEFEDAAEYVRRRVPELTTIFGPFDAVVALTHMRMPNDRDLAAKCGGEGGVDIILGGHDHHYEDAVTNGVRVLNSGCDFRTFTVVDVRGRGADGRLDTSSARVDVPPDGPEDPGVAESIREVRELAERSMEVVIGRTRVPLDARFSEIRTRETNVSNFLADVMTRATGADVAVLNAGSIRADRILEKGDITVRDLCDLLPQADEIAVVGLTGEELLRALENGVSAYPAMEGRFPAVDGVRFAFDPSEPAGSRVVPGSVFVKEKDAGGRRASMVRRRGQEAAVVAAVAVAPAQASGEDEKTPSVGTEHDGVKSAAPRGFAPLDPQRTYSVASKSYLLSGKDGYDCFVGAPVLLEEEDCPVLPTMVRNVFTELRVLKRWAGLTSQGAVISSASRFKALINRSVADPFAISPQVDGRIKNVQE